MTLALSERTLNERISATRANRLILLNIEAFSPSPVVHPTTMFIYWEVRDETLRHLERTRPGGTIHLRILVVQPTWDGPRSILSLAQSPWQRCFLRGQLTI